MRRVTYDQLVTVNNTRDFPISGATRVFVGILNAAAVNVTGNYFVYSRTSGGNQIPRQFNTGALPPAGTYWNILPDINAVPIIPVADVLRVQPTGGNAWFIVHVDYEE